MPAGEAGRGDLPRDACQGRQPTGAESLPSDRRLEVLRPVPGQRGQAHDGPDDQAGGVTE